MKDNRYQFQPWYVKLWRRRHYISVPFMALGFWDTEMSWRTSWSLAKGLAQGKMNWVYTMKEVMERIEKRERKEK